MFKLKNYQQIVYDKLIDRIKLKERKILVLGATGFGKTILSFIIAKNAIEKNNRVLFTNHRIALAKQTLKKFKTLNPELLQGDNKLKNQNALLIVASLQTLINSEIPDPKIIIIDECHYGYKGNMIQSLFKKFPNAFFIGLSATPVDDKDCLLDGWDSIIDDYQTKDLIDMQELTPFNCFAENTIDLSKVKVKGNEFEEEELLNVLIKENINKTVVDGYIKNGQNRAFICFAINKKHCIELKKEFNQRGVLTEIIDANTTDKNREKFILQLKNNEIKGLISIEILTAGFDEPSVSCVIFATATMQWKKYIQCAGRGIRLLGLTYKDSVANGKSDCIVLDYCGNIERHGMPDERKVFKYGKKISRVIDREFNLSEKYENKKIISQEKQIYLKQIGSLLDLYENKNYNLESELQEDVNNFLKKTNFFWWRQNSGKAFIKDRWVHFASKNGLPDNSVFYNDTSFFFALELKLPAGKLTSYQKETLPEMTQKKVLFFICESVYDVFLAIEHVEKNIHYNNDFLMINNEIYKLSQRQLELRNKLKIPNYAKT